MKSTNSVIKASLITVLLASGATFAQTLPDEINHPQYLKILETLEQTLNVKLAEFEKLSQQKKDLQVRIAQMEKDQRDLPARNSDLQNQINDLNSEITKINSDLKALETILGQVVEDLKRLDAVIAQLQNDYNVENSRLESIKARRSQVAADAARLNAQLQRELRDERQSMNTLDRLGAEFNSASSRKAELQNERRQLAIDVQSFKVQIPAARNTINLNNQKLSVKKPELIDVHLKLDPLNKQIQTEQKRLDDTDLILNDRKTRLTKLKAELASIQPDITKLQLENKNLAAKITSNTTKIQSIDVSSLLSKKDALERDMGSLNAELTVARENLLTAQENIKPDIAKLNDYNQKIKDAQAARNQAEVSRLRAEKDEFEKTLIPKRDVIVKLNKEIDRISLLLAPKMAMLKDLESLIAKNQALIASLQKENTEAQAKIDTNTNTINQRSASTTTLVQQITELEGLIKAQTLERDAIAKNLINLKVQASSLNGQAKKLSDEISRMENENSVLAQRIVEMEKVVGEFPHMMRRIELNIDQLEEILRQKSFEISREEKLLARIRQDRIAAEINLNNVQEELDRLNQEMVQSQGVVDVIARNLNENTQKRNSLVRYNQDSIRKYDSLRAKLAQNQNDISGAKKEIEINNQDLATVARELPTLRQELVSVTNKANAAETAKNEAQKKADEAKEGYDVRFSLYQKYLAEASSMGTERASVGTVDGNKAGVVDSKTKAQKLGSESASLEAKWIALKMGYVRGEIAGFKQGFSAGVASLPDSQKGEQDGKLAGAKRAKDHANLVLKPEIYLEELVKRIKEAPVSSSTIVSTLKLFKVSSKAAHLMLEQPTSDIPELSNAEINEAASIISSLDPLIERSAIEVSDVLNLRTKLSNAQNVYTSPDASSGASNAKCDGVYKNVKDFAEACKSAYGAKYQVLFKAAHQQAFIQNYAAAFKAQIQNVYFSELTRLYPVYLQKATVVGNEVGISSGKKEVYQQSFNRAEEMAFAANLPVEEVRVTAEAGNLVTNYLNKNAALSVIKQSLSSTEDLAPGTEAELKMVVKNAGAVKSVGDSLVRITDASSNIVLEKREITLSAVDAKKQAELAVLKIRVTDNAEPGSKVSIKGQIIHPGNDYSATRVEDFNLESTLLVNTAAELSAKFDSTPKVTTFFGSILRHEIELSVKPLFKGVDENYKVSLEEVGTQFTEIFTKEAIVAAGKQGVAEKAEFNYRFFKSARGKAVVLRFTVKNGDKIVKTLNIPVNPK